ncbi:MAG: amino acid adenylation domain-containing protein [Spirochaetales bacterium]|nr:amino acid adenylation domain-containing protein [Spirochaetales bacterium]
MKKNDTIKDIYTLSPMQEGLLFNYLSGETSKIYNVQIIFTLQGTLDARLFEESYLLLIKKYDMLRTSFIYEGIDRPRQVVLKTKKGMFVYEDIRTLSDEEKESFLDGYIKADKSRHFDLKKDPLFRISLIRKDDSLYTLIITHHHIILDGWSFAIILKELFGIYDEFCRTGGCEPGTSYPYKNYIQWLMNQDKESAGEYWKEYLSDYVAGDLLPGLYNTSCNRDYTFNEYTYIIDEKRKESLIALSRETGVTLNSILQVLVGLLFMKLGNTDDFVFGNVVSGRDADIAGIESIVGLCINTIPVRIKIRQNDSFCNLVKKVHGEFHESNRMSFLSPGEIQKVTCHKKNFIKMLYVFENYPLAANLKNGKLIDSLEVSIKDILALEQTNYDLNVKVIPGNELEVIFSYNRNVIKTFTIQKITVYFNKMIDDILGNPYIPVRDMELLSDNEKREILYGYNTVVTDYTESKTLNEHFEDQVVKYPGAIALSFKGKTLTYKELNDKANQLAHMLRLKGVGPESIVGLFLNKSLEMMIGIMGILKAGGAYLPIEPEYPPERYRFMLEDSGTHILLTQDRFLDTIDFPGDIVSLENEDAFSGPGTNLDIKNKPDNLAYVIYTSGSTGVPKGTLTLHSNVVRVVKNSNYIDIQPGDTLLQLSNYAFDGSIFDIFGALLNGAKLVIMDQADVHNPDRLPHIIRKEKISVFFMTTSLFNALVDMEAGCLQDVRKIVFGGEKASYYHVKKAFDLLGSGRLINGYGPTETTVFAACYQVNQVDDPVYTIPVGKGIAKTLLYIVDKNLNLVPAGTPGELCISGAGVARGYLKRPQLTAERFMEDPFTPGLTMYRTGDVCRWLDNGNIEYIGRADDQVKIRGFRIEPQEITYHVGRYKGIKEAVVLEKTDGNQRKYLCCYFAAEKEIDKEEIKRYLSVHLPEYMVPSYFIQIDHLPLTVNGKIDKTALPEPETGKSMRNDYEAPCNEREEKMVNIWQELFHLEKIGVKDNFFELGGDSILSIQAVSRALKQKIKITVDHIFRYQTIKEILLHSPGIHETETGTTSETGEIPLIPIQHWFFEQTIKDRNLWNQMIKLKMNRPVPAETVNKAINILVQRYDVLRYVYAYNHSHWVQSCTPFKEDTFVVTVNLAGVNECDDDKTIRRHIDIINRSINIEKGPLIKAIIFSFEHKEFSLLYIAIHHLVVDGVSWRIIMEELESIVNSLDRGEVIKQLPGANSFRQWAARLKEYATKQEVLNDSGYWEKQLDRDFPGIPVDYDNEVNYIKEVKRVGISLDKQETGLLLRSAGKAYAAHIDHLLLAASGLALKEWTGNTRFLIDLEGHGRKNMFDDIDVSLAIGWFTVMYPFAMDLAHTGSIGDVVKTIKESFAHIPGNGLSYGLLRYMDSGDVMKFRDFPCAEISFNYLGQFDTLLAKNSFFTCYDDNFLELIQSENNENTCTLIITGYVLDDMLSLDIMYNSKQYNEQTIVKFANNVKNNLKSIIRHCHDAITAGYSLSDFPGTGLNQEESDRLLDTMKNKYPGNDIEAIYPLSPVQEGILYHALSEPESDMYFEQFCFKLKGTINIEALRRAWQVVVDRYSILRTFFTRDYKDNFLQGVVKNVPIPFEIMNWEMHPGKAITLKVEEFLKEQREKVFDLSQAPLMRFQLIIINENEHFFIWNFHHIILDGWSVGIILQKVFAIYGNKPEMQQTPDGYNYIDFIRWIRQQDKEKARLFWRDQLKGLTASTRMKIKYQDNEQIPSGESVYLQSEISINPQLSLALNDFSRKYKITMNTIFQAAWGFLLSKYSGENDIIFGATVSGRKGEIENVEYNVGIFINTLPIRLTIDGNDTVTGFLEKVQDSHIKQLEYDYVSLSEIHNVSEIPYEESLFDTLMVFENYPVDTSLFHQLGNLEIEDLKIFEKTNYPLTILVSFSPVLKIIFLFDSQLYTYPVINQISKNLTTILEQFVQYPDSLLSSLHLLTGEERALLNSWNTTSENYEDTLLHLLFEKQAMKTPERTAIQIEDETINYGELNAKANKLAHYLKKKGVGADVPVAVFFERSIDMIICVLAVLKAEGAYVPIDTSYPGARITSILKDTTPALVLLSNSHREHLTGMDTGEKLCFPGAWNEIGNESGENIIPSITTGNLCYILFTSGSTGTPKGIAMPHKPLSNLMQWQHHAIDNNREYRTLQFASLCFDVSNQEIFSTLGFGGTLVLVREETRTDFLQLLKYIERQKIERVYLPFIALQNLAYTAMEETIDIGKNLVQIITAGEQLKLTEDIKRLLSGNKNCLLFNQYGPTESHVVTHYQVHRNTFDSNTLPPIGKPIAHARIYILDTFQKPLPVGLVGELYIGGDVLARGYYNKPVQTGERFVPDPFTHKENSIMYKTGDLARYVPDGNIEYVGRVDFQVKIRGYRVEIHEIEKVLGGHEKIKDAVVHCFKDDAGNNFLVAYIVLHHTNEEIDTRELNNYIKERLPDYMVPSRYSILESLPLTSTGKVNRRALPRVIEDTGEKRKIVAPEDPVQEVLLELWEKVLNRTGIGITDNFFELGGHSLKALNVTLRIKKKFNVEIHVSDIFKYPTIKEISGLIKETGISITTSIKPAAKMEYYPAASPQRRLFALQTLSGLNTAYNMYGAFSLHGNVDVNRMSDAFLKIIRRHEAFRTSFHVINGEVCQKIHDTVHFTLVYEEASAKTGEELLRDFVAPFDLKHAPLFRGKLVKRGEENYILLLDMHHIISDGTSVGILFRDLKKAYEGQELKEINIHYKDYVMWQGSDEYRQHIALQEEFWLSLFKNGVPGLMFPADFKRPGVQGFEGGHYEFQLDEEKINGICREYHVTPFMLLLSCFTVLLAKYSGQDEVVVGSVIAGRDHADLSEVIGMLANSLPLVGRPDGNKLFRDYLYEIKELAFQFYRNQMYPFELLVEKIADPRDVRRNPVFDIAFLVQNMDIDDLRMGDIDVSYCDIENKSSKFDLTLIINNYSGTLSGMLEYSVRLFKKSTIERIAGHFTGFVNTIETNINKKIGEIALFSRAEEEELTKQFGFFRGTFYRNGCSGKLSIIRNLLFANSAVGDCFVLYEEGDICVYYVLSLPVTPFRLDMFLKDRLPGYYFPLLYLEVDAIPRFKNGDVNVVVLQKKKTLSSSDITEIEDALKNEMVEDCHLLVTYKSNKKWIPVSTNETENRQNVSCKNVVSPGVPDTPAISHGAGYRERYDDSWSLKNVLEIAAKTEKKIIYLSENGLKTEQSYNQLSNDAKRFAGNLKRKGLGKGDKVIFQFSENIDFIRTFWGCVLIGVIPVPISPIMGYKNKNSDTEKLYNVIRFLDFPSIICSEKLFIPLNGLKELYHDNRLIILPVNELDVISNDEVSEEIDKDDTAIILFTSGSTGMPKGVMQSHKNLICRSIGAKQCNALTGNDISLNWMPLDHVGGIVMFHLMDIFVPCNQIHVPKQLILNRPLLWLELMSEYKATVTWAPHFAYGLVNEYEKEIASANLDLTSLRFILNGGEAIVAKTARKFLKILQQHGLPGTAMKPAYGMSETCSGITFSHEFTLENTHDTDKFVSVGFPIPGVSIRIVNENNQMINEGEIGKLQVRGNTITQGYYRNEETTKTSFTDDGWFDTGDLGFLLNGRLTVTGRAKNIIIINGINYYCQEIETCVEELEEVSTSFVAACAVKTGEENTDSCAVFYSPENGKKGRREDNPAYSRVIHNKIREKVLNQCGLYIKYLIPVKKENFPKTEIGKIQRIKLRNLFEQGHFDDVLDSPVQVMGSNHKIPAWFYEKVWQPRALQDNRENNMPGRNKIILIGIDDKNVIEELRKRGFQIIIAMAGSSFSSSGETRFSMNLEMAIHFRKLYENINMDSLHSIILCLQGDDHNDMHLPALLQRMTDMVTAPVRALDEGYAVNYIVVTEKSFVLDKKEIFHPRAGIIQGLLKTIALEHSPVITCQIDIDDMQQLPFILADELLLPCKDSDVAYRDGMRYLPLLIPASAGNPGKLIRNFNSRHLVVVTGGLGGVGYHVCRWLLHEYGINILILGRTEIADAERTGNPVMKERKEKLEALKAINNGKVFYEAIDITDHVLVRKLVHDIEMSWNVSLVCIFHLAGSLSHTAGTGVSHWKEIENHLMVNETGESYRTAYAPKILATRALNELRHKNKDIGLVVFSSVNGFFGGASLGAYAAANSFLEPYCIFLQDEYPETYCLHWSMWQGLGLSRDIPETLREGIHTQGYELINEKDGILSLRYVMENGIKNCYIGLDPGALKLRKTVIEDRKPEIELFYKNPGKNVDGFFTAIKGKLEHKIVRTYDLALYEVKDIPRLSDDSRDIDVQKMQTLKKTGYDSAGKIESAGYAAPGNEIEKRLAGIWQSVLKIDRVGINDNFFELGGDSIKAIQVASRLGEYNYAIEIADILQQPTIRELALYVREKTVVIDQSGVMGDIPLSPVQKWFINQKFSHPHHFNMSIMLHHKKGFDPACVTEIIQRLVTHHDALRIVLKRDNEAVFNKPAGKPEVFLEVVDAINIENVEETIKEESLRLQGSIDLYNGPLVKVCLFKTKEGDHLFFSIHHLIIDTVSWRILLHDFVTGYDHLLSGKDVALPLKTHSWMYWIGHVYEYCFSERVKQQLPYWKNVCSACTDVQSFAEFIRDRNTNRNVKSLQFELNESDTRELLTKVNQAYNTAINDILLSALSLAVIPWSGKERFLINLEGHGREELFKDMDIKRTAGWFTVFYPFILEIYDEYDRGKQIVMVKEALRKVPDHGFGYTLLRYLPGIPEIDKKELDIAPEIWFNYLGQFDDTFSHDDISISRYGFGRSISMDNEVISHIGFTSYIVNSIFTVNCDFDSNKYTHDSIKRLMELFNGYLLEIVSHCSSSKKSFTTPADFSDDSLSMDELDSIKLELINEE